MVLQRFYLARCWPNSERGFRSLFWKKIKHWNKRKATCHGASQTIGRGSFSPRVPNGGIVVKTNFKVSFLWSNFRTRIVQSPLVLHVVLPLPTLILTPMRWVTLFITSKLMVRPVLKQWSGASYQNFLQLYFKMCSIAPSFCINPVYHSSNGCIFNSLLLQMPIWTEEEWVDITQSRNVLI